MKYGENSQLFIHFVIKSNEKIKVSKFKDPYFSNIFSAVINYYFGYQYY